MLNPVIKAARIATGFQRKPNPAYVTMAACQNQPIGRKINKIQIFLYLPRMNMIKMK
jgi:hypothetical protein